MKLFQTILLMFLSVAMVCEDDVIVWPKPGSVFPVKKKNDSEIDKKRLASDYWVNSPKIISALDRNWFDYQTIMWGGDNRIKGDIYYPKLKDIYVKAGMVYSDYGADTIKGANLPFYNTNVANILYISNKGGADLISGYKKTRDKKYLVRSTKKGNATLESEAVDSEVVKIAKGIASNLSSLKPLAYDLRDEGTYVNSSACPIDFDFSPESLSFFRLWLKQKYASLDALNGQWDTKFASWDAVMPLTTDEIQSREFAKSKETSAGTMFTDLNLSPWADHRDYNDDTYYAALARYTNAIHSADPGAPVGYSGTQMPSAYGGFDFWKICTNISWLEYYDCNGSRELIRSFMPKDFPKISAINPKEDMRLASTRVWKQILHGDAGVLVWPYGKVHGQTLLFDKVEDGFKLNQKAHDMGALFRELRNGISIQLQHSDLICNDVAFYYSQASLRVDWMLEVKRDAKSWINRNSSWETVHNFAANGREGYYKVLEDAGYQFTNISYAQVEQNLMASMGIKVIILPRIISLSALEIKNLKSFVEAGGVLVSDLHAGRMDEHCTLYKNGSPMDELLGVERGQFVFQEDKKPEIAKFGYVGGYGSTFKVNVTEDFGLFKKGESFDVKGFQEPNQKLKTAKSFGKANGQEVLIKNNFGKGVVYTLNFDFANYLQERNSLEKPVYENCQKQRNVFSSILQESKVSKFCEITDESGTYPAGIESFVFQLGDMKILAVHTNDAQLIDWETLMDIADKKERKNSLKLKFKLPESVIVTEMLTGKVFGKIDSIEADLKKEKPLLFSLMNYEVDELSVEAKNESDKGLLSVKIDVKSKSTKLEDHVVNVELVDSEGQPVPTFLVNVPLVKGSYQGQLDFSVIEKGVYKLVFKDVLSSKTTTKNIEIK